MSSTYQLPLDKLNSSLIQSIIDEVVSVSKTLESNKRDLSPHNQKITETLSSFVSHIVEYDQCLSAEQKQEILENPVIKKLRPKLLKNLSMAEYQMELHFSNLFLEKETLDESDLDAFWYLQNYKDLIDAEIKHITLKDLENEVVFIGSGPLPLSALILSKKTGISVTCIDADASAVERGRKLIEKLGMSDEVSFIHGDGKECNFEKTSLVIIASLVDDKAAVVDQILKTSKSVTSVALRSAEGLHALLYAPVTSGILNEFNLKVTEKTTPIPSVINSTLFCQQRKFN